MKINISPLFDKRLQNKGKIHIKPWIFKNHIFSWSRNSCFSNNFLTRIMVYCEILKSHFSMILHFFMFKQDFLRSGFLVMDSTVLGLRGNFRRTYEASIYNACFWNFLVTARWRAWYNQQVDEKGWNLLLLSDLGNISNIFAIHLNLIKYSAFCWPMVLSPLLMWLQ